MSCYGTTYDLSSHKLSKPETHTYLFSMLATLSGNNYVLNDHDNLYVNVSHIIW